MSVSSANKMFVDVGTNAMLSTPPISAASCCVLDSYFNFSLNHYVEKRQIPNSVTFIDTQKKCDCFYVNCAMLHVKGLISVKGTFANKFNGSRTCSLYNTGQCFYPKDKTSNITAGKGRTSDL
ncbi:unnamed protein product [Bubo scandiacus]